MAAYPWHRWKGGSVMRSYPELLDQTNTELSHIDPLEQNLLVAKAPPVFADLDTRPFRRQADRWAEEFRRWLSAVEQEFRRRTGTGTSTCSAWGCCANSSTGRSASLTKKASATWRRLATPTLTTSSSPGSSRRGAA